MLKAILTASLLLLFGARLLAQQKNPAAEQSVRDNINLNAFNVTGSRFMYGIDEDPGKLLGDIYLDTAFQYSTVFFYKDIVKKIDPRMADSVSGYRVRLDLREHVLEFVVGNVVKGIEENAIRKVVYKAPEATGPIVLVNAREFTGGVPEKIKGFVRQLSSGDVEVFKYNDLNLRQPTYNPAVAAGDKNAYYYQQATYFYRDASNTLVPVKAKNKKALLELLSKRRAAVESFLEKTGNNLKTDEELIQVLAFYNQKDVP
jgi:hypothetical protein